MAQRPIPARNECLVIALVRWHNGMCSEVEFATDGLLSDFDIRHMPREVECVEILAVVWSA